MLHCVEYIKQSIMCCGDTSLEKGIERNGTVVAETNGWGTMHECRSWDAVYEWATEISFE